MNKLDKVIEELEADRGRAPALEADLDLAYRGAKSMIRLRYLNGLLAPPQEKPQSSQVPQGQRPALFLL